MPENTGRGAGQSELERDSDISQRSLATLKITESPEEHVRQNLNIFGTNVPSGATIAPTSRGILDRSSKS
jgi:hypothetical protein